MEKIQLLLSFTTMYWWFGVLCVVGLLGFFVYRIADFLQIRFVQNYSKPTDLDLSDDIYNGKKERKLQRSKSGLWQGMTSWVGKGLFIFFGIPILVVFLANLGLSYTWIYIVLIVLSFLLNLLFSKLFSIWTPARLAADYPANQTTRVGNLTFQAWGIVTWAGPMYAFWYFYQSNGWVGSVITLFVSQIIQLLFFIYTIKKIAIPYQEYPGLSAEFKQNLHQYLESQGLQDKEVGVLTGQEEPNAFATGLFGYRQIIMTEGIIQGYTDPANPNFTLKLRDDTLESIVAHEVGHIKLHHIEKSIFVGTLISSLVTVAVYTLFSNPLMFPIFLETTGQQIMLYWGQSLFDIMLMYPLTFLMMGMARYNENQADSHLLATHGHKHGYDFFYQIRHIAPVANDLFWHDCNMTHPEPHIREKRMRDWEKDHAK